MLKLYSLLNMWHKHWWWWRSLNVSSSRLIFHFKWSFFSCQTKARHLLRVWFPVWKWSFCPVTDNCCVVCLYFGFWNIQSGFEIVKKGHWTQKWTFWKICFDSKRSNIVNSQIKDGIQITVKQIKAGKTLMCNTCLLVIHTKLIIMYSSHSLNNPNLFYFAVFFDR